MRSSETVEKVKGYFLNEHVLLKSSLQMETVKQCQLCEFRTSSMAFLLKHLATVHSNRPGFYFICGLNCCQRTFRNITTYKHHVYAAHSKYHTNLLGTSQRNISQLVEGDDGDGENDDAQSDNEDAQIDGCNNPQSQDGDEQAGNVHR